MERYSIEKAQVEAEKLQKAVDSGNASDFPDAEKKLDQDGIEGENKGMVDNVNDILKLKNPVLTKTIRRSDIESTNDGGIYTAEHSRADADYISDATFALYMLNDFEKDPKRLEKARHFFEGRIVVDIGAGSGWHGYEIAKKLGCKAYIAVEPYFAKSLAKRLSNYKDLPFVVISDDALTFLENIPDGSVSIMTFGTDNLMFRDEDYNHELRKEISRCLSKDGGFLSRDSILYPSTEKDQEKMKSEFIGSGQLSHH